MNWADILRDLPLIAILRGLTPDEAIPVADALYEGGVRCVEVPLNSPQPLQSIAAIRREYDGRMFVGAGTVLTVTDVADVVAADGAFVVSPNTDASVIAATKSAGLVSLPGFFSPSEGFAALAAGADGLKLFPADHAGPAYVKALKAVLPPAAPLFAVGGVDESRFGAYLAAGAAGFGLGSTLYKPGDAPAHVKARASALARAFREVRA